MTALPIMTDPAAAQQGVAWIRRVAGEKTGVIG